MRKALFITAATALMATAPAHAGDKKITNPFKAAAKEKLATKADASLLDAATRKDHAQLKALLAAGANPDHIVKGDGTALIIAAGLGDIKAVEMLVRAGANLDLAVIGDGNPLIAAAGAGHDKIVTYLIRQGADVEKWSKHDGNPLINAAAGNHLKVAKILIASGAKVDAIVPTDETALINAAQAGHLSMVKYLIEKAGADISLGVIANKDNRPQWRSPLSEARRMGHGTIVAYLESKGAVEGSI